MSSGAGQTAGSLLAAGCNLWKVCNRNIERLAAIAFSFEGKCCAEKINVIHCSSPSQCPHTFHNSQSVLYAKCILLLNCHRLKYSF